jgi:hypothetical protein
MRVLRPAEGVYAFYDGRVDGYRFADGLNWVDDGALSLGIASYAIVAGDEALVYDTHVSVEHGRVIHAVLEGRACGSSRSFSATGISITSPGLRSSRIAR